MLTRLFTVVAMLCWSAWASAAPETRLAVLEFTGDFTPSELGVLSDVARGAAVRRRGASVYVITRENMEVMLQDMGIDPTCLAEGSCEVDTGKIVQADYVGSGRVVRFGGAITATVKLHATDDGQLLEATDVESDHLSAMKTRVAEAVSEVLVPRAGEPTTPLVRPSSTTASEGVAILPMDDLDAALLAEGTSQISDVAPLPRFPSAHTRFP